MSKVLWLKSHPLSGCHVGEIENIQDEKREATLKKGGFVRDITKEEENALSKEQTEKATGK
ncbi:hypothetical protein [Emticicia fontis]